LKREKSNWRKNTGGDEALWVGGETQGIKKGDGDGRSGPRMGG